jgi:hypothetical protein
MLRKLLLPFLAILLLIACIFFYMNLRQSRPSSVNALIAIPTDAVFILETKQTHTLFRRVEESNILWEDLKVTQTFRELRKNLLFLDSLLQGNTKLLKLGLDDHPLYISAHPTENTCAFLFSYALPDLSLKNSFEEILASNFHVKPLRNEVLSLSTNDRNEICYYAYTNGILLFSPSENLIRKAILQSKMNTSVLNDKGFADVYNTSKSSRFDLRLFVNFSKITLWSGAFMNTHYADLLQNDFPLGGWAAMDANMKPKSVLLNGFVSYRADSSYLNLFKGQEAQHMDALGAMPSNTASFIYEGFSDFHAYFTKFSALRKKCIQNQLDSINRRYGTDFSKVCSSWIENEVASLITEPGPGAMDLSSCTFILLRSDNIEHTTAELSVLCGLVCKTDSLKPDTLMVGKHVIRHLKIKGILPMLLGESFAVTENYYTVLDNYLLFGNSPDALKNYLHFTDNDHFLNKDGHYDEFSSNLSSKCNLFVYSNIARSTSIYQSFASEETAKDISTYSDLFIKFEALGVQFSSQGNLFYNTAYLEENPIYKKETSTLWETRLDTTFHRAPQLLLNHQTHNLDVCVQDDGNKLYLVSSTGKILWSRSLTEKIQGKIVQVDAFSNKKFQMLFNTRNSIYLIDLNGKNVEGFPVQLPSPACNGLTVVDYENKSDYRILIACADKHILNYTIHGKKTEGWKSPVTSDTVVASIIHAVAGRKDYIIVADLGGQPYVYNRHGEAQIELHEKLPKPLSGFSVDPGRDLAHYRIISTDSLGNICRISLDGKSEHISFKLFNHKPWFLFSDLNADHIPEFIFQDANEMTVFTEDKSVLFSYHFDDTILQPPFYLQDPSGHGRVGIVNESKEEIYLLNESGTFPEGFPLRGTVPFSIGDLNRDNTLQLITGEGKNIYAYSIP